jgi:uncharacterized protein (TIGR02996 family)
MPMTAHEESRQLDAIFLRDVVGNPKDDTTLLIYADWLMDQPDEPSRTRGEYLRLTWLMERTAGRRERRDLHWRAQTLWWTNVESWLGPLYDAVDHFLYERGRLCVEVSEATFLRLSLAELAACPAWDWVTDVGVRKGGLDLLLHLGESPRPPLLQSVDFGPTSLEEGELVYLLEQGFWKGVAELDLNRNRIGPSDVTALAYWPGVVGVKRLNLQECDIGDEGGLSLARSPYLSEVERLMINAVYVDHDTLYLLMQRFGERLTI